MHWNRVALPCVALVVAAAVSIPVLVGSGSSHSAVSKPAAPKQDLPRLTPQYTVEFQAILDDARPKGEKRIVVHDCRAGRYGNEHFCAWIDTKGRCQAGFIQEQPGNGTVPVQVGRVNRPPRGCYSGPILREFFARARAGSPS